MAMIRCDFILTGHGCDPDIITQALGVQPTYTWRAGEQVPNSLVRYKQDGWRLTTGPVESLDVQEVARPLLTQLLPLVDALTDLTKQLGIEAELAFTVRMGGKVPAVHFDREMLGAINQLQAEVDIDLYI